MMILENESVIKLHWCFWSYKNIEFQLIKVQGMTQQNFHISVDSKLKKPTWNRQN